MTVEITTTQAEIDINARNRAALRDFLNSVTEEDISNAVHRVLQDYPYREYTEYEVLAISKLNFDVLSQYCPGWINPRGYILELLKLNSPDLWELLIEKVSQRLATAGKPLDIHLPGGHPLGEAIALRNAQFFGLSTIGIGHAAVIGIHARNMFHDEAHAQHAMPAIEYAGNMFVDQPQSFDELLVRLRTLFPPVTLGQATAASGSALKCLMSTNTFQIPYTVYERSNPSDRGDVISSGHRACPAVGLTSHIYGAYGRQLQESAYISQLRAQISR